MKIPKDFLLLLGRRFLSLLVEEKTVAKRKGKQMYRVVNIIRRHWLVRLESFRHKSIGSRSDPALIQLLYILVADVTQQSTYLWIVVVVDENEILISCYFVGI
jgi:hypothetical protein